jgi:N6-adenosine-specific RNA methylase IME4
MKYRTIVADPPWMERGGGKIKRGADRHYSLLFGSDMAYVITGADMWQPADDCHLWLWATNNHLPDAIALVGELGFRYVTNLCWVKDRIGLGRYLRGMHELCLFGVRGETCLPKTILLPSVLHAKRREHSRKPDEFFALVERTSPGPYLEMFARRARLGWDTWGNECLEHVTTEPTTEEAP